MIYFTSSKNVRAAVAENGFAVIPCVLDDTECEAMVSGLWDFLEHITREWTLPISRHDPITWKEIYKLYPSHGMLLQHWGIGHAQVNWDLRQNRKILSIFREIYGVHDLLTSFDGSSVGLMPEVTKRGWQIHNWYHTDQSYTRPGFECIQSWVTGENVQVGDATLTVLRGSHLFHAEFAARFGITDKANWFKLSPEQLDFYILEKGCVKVNIECPKGSMTFWDSRTIHCGKNPDKGREFPKCRMVSYMCMMPRSIATNKDLEKKRKACEELRVTSHWPAPPKLFSKFPRTYGAPLPHITALPFPVLDYNGRRLAGYPIKPTEVTESDYEDEDSPTN